MDLKELDQTTSTFSRHPWELARLSIVKKILLKSIENSSSNADLNVVDIGCGDAFVASSLAKEFSGISFTAYDSFFTNETLNQLNSKYAKLENLELSSALQNNQKTIHIALLLDVLEHIENDSNFLKELKSHVKIDSNTDFIIMVPAFQILFSKHDKFLGHHRRYNKSSLSGLLHESGYEIKEMNYFFLYPLLIRATQKFLELKTTRRDKMETGVSDWKYRSAITTIINNSLLLDYYIFRFISLIGIKLPGLSLYCICRPVV